MTYSCFKDYQFVKASQKRLQTNKEGEISIIYKILNKSKNLTIFILFFSLMLLASCGKNFPLIEKQINPDSASQLNLDFTNPRNQIIGGQEITSKLDPIAKTTVLIYNILTRQICTGSLLENNLILTAAHCVHRQTQSMLIYFIQNSRTATKEMSRLVTGAVTHPLWVTNKNNQKDAGDIALLKYLGETPQGYTAATFLPNPSYLLNNTPIVLAGYGIADSRTKQGSEILRQTATAISNNRYSYTEIQVDQRLGRGSCHGDSGGPAFIVINGTHYLWGILSRGDQDREDKCNQFSLYTLILAHYKWIQETAKALILNPNLNQVSMAAK